MKQILLIALLASSTLLVQGQSIRAAGDKMPVVRQSATAGTPASYTGRQIAVGGGGGVTGYSIAYYLLENGKLFGKRSRDTTFTFIGQQTAANTKRVFSAAEEKCRIKTTKFDNPGNIFKFVRWRKAKQEYIVTWGAAGKTVPANYPKFYDSFMAMIPAVSKLK
ncbi:FAD-binding oxidoreductase [Spirosoma aerophilum]